MRRQVLHRRSFGPTVPNWTPLSLGASLVYWYRGDALFDSGFGMPSGFTDLSGNGYALAQLAGPLGTIGTLFGQPCYNATGGVFRLLNPGGNPFNLSQMWFVVVGQATNLVTANSPLWFHGPFGTPRGYGLTANSFTDLGLWTGNIGTDGVSLPIGPPFLPGSSGYSCDGVTTTFRVGGGMVPIFTFPANVAVYAGDSIDLNVLFAGNAVNVAEAWLANAPPTPADIVGASAYLLNRYTGLV